MGVRDIVQINGLQHTITAESLSRYTIIYAHSVAKIKRNLKMDCILIGLDIKNYSTKFNGLGYHSLLAEDALTGHSVYFYINKQTLWWIGTGRVMDNDIRHILYEKETRGRRRRENNKFVRFKIFNTLTAASTLVIVSLSISFHKIMLLHQDSLPWIQVEMCDTTGVNRIFHMHCDPRLYGPPESRL